jgi:hypothetical protein
MEFLNRQKVVTNYVHTTGVWQSVYLKIIIESDTTILRMF